MGRDKAFLDAGGIPLIAYMIDRLKPIATEVLVAARDSAKFAGLRARVVVDELTPPCSLAGIHALLKAAREPAVFVCAVDMPYLNEGLIAHLFENLEAFDAVLPQGESGIEPLCAIFTRACLKSIEASATAGRLKITDAIADCNVRVLPIRESEWAILGSSPFTNVNAPDEYEAFRRKLSGR